MRFKDKLLQHMVLKNYNQSKLARASGVSDSEISRILRGDPQNGPFPGLENAFRLARAVGVSLDYLADDALDADPVRPPEPASPDEREVLELAGKMGFRDARRLLDAASILGFEVAIRRLLGSEMKPLIEVGPGDVARQAPPAPPAGRANSA